MLKFAVLLSAAATVLGRDDIVQSAAATVLGRERGECIF